MGRQLEITPAGIFSEARPQQRLHLPPEIFAISASATRTIVIALLSPRSWPTTCTLPATRANPLTLCSLSLVRRVREDRVRPGNSGAAGY
jgi:hypothetical protein